MKNLEEPFFHNNYFEGVCLVRDDIEYILGLMGKQSMIQTIADENFEYESLDEFIEKRGMHPFKFEIIAAFGDPLQQNYYKIGLEFKAARVALYGHGSQTSLYHQIKEFLASKSYWHFKVADPWIWALMFIPLLTIVGWIVSRTIGKGESTPEWPIFVLLVNILLVGFCIIYRKTGFGVSLIPHHQSTFLKRNADKIGLLFVGTILGILSTLIVQSLSR